MEKPWGYHGEWSPSGDPAAKNPWGLRSLGFWPWDLPRDSIHQGGITFSSASGHSFLKFSALRAVFEKFATKNCVFQIYDKNMHNNILALQNLQYGFKVFKCTLFDLHNS